MQNGKKRTPKTASLKHERKYLALGCKYIIGVDEAGRGPWAGPVTAGAVCLPIQSDSVSKDLRGVRDSKQMTALQRTKLVEQIKTQALAYGIGSISAQEIDNIGIIPATIKAMQNAILAALEQADFEPDCLFIDDMLLPEMRQIAQVSLIEGDSRSLSIAAASVLAKTWRDAYMMEMDVQYPEYGFARHKGYGTPEHLAALKLHGPSPIHRMTYKPIRALSDEDDE